MLGREPGSIHEWRTVYAGILDDSSAISMVEIDRVMQQVSAPAVS